MKNILKGKFEIANGFVMNTIVSVDELIDHDMIYIYHHLKVGSMVTITAAGTNVKGDLKFQVSFKQFVLGYITLSPLIGDVYKSVTTMEAEIVGIKKQKFLPIKGLDIALQATKMRMVS